jgi:hypothetical protein
MGYTHYWYRPVGSEIAPDVWQAICDDARKLMQSTDVSLVFEYDVGLPPQVDDVAIRFNGPASHGHETFMVERVCPPQRSYRQDRPEAFAFCKTAGKKYDLVVCAILAVICERCPEFRILSDGTTAEWQVPLKFAAETLGRPFNMMFDAESRLVVAKN